MGTAVLERGRIGSTEEILNGVGGMVQLSCRDELANRKSRGAGANTDEEWNHQDKQPAQKSGGPVRPPRRFRESSLLDPGGVANPRSDR